MLLLQEAQLARELAEKEELALQLEEHFSSLQEEVDVKTKKLKKLWNKYQGALREVKDLQDEFSRERGDLLDTIRQLTQSLKLKDLLLAHFVPPDFVSKMEQRAVFSPEEDTWLIPRLDLTGNALRSGVSRPLSTDRDRDREGGGKGYRRPESDFAKSRKVVDSNPRYRGENVLSLELEGAERTTEVYSGPSMKSQLDHLLSSEDRGYDEVVFDGVTAHYLSYGPGGVSDRDRDREIERETDRERTRERPKTGKKKATAAAASTEEVYGGERERPRETARPRSASRRRGGEREGADRDRDRDRGYGDRDEEEYGGRNGRK